MENFIVIFVLALVIFAAGYYIYKARKAGNACIGCPDSGSCPHKNTPGGCQGCKERNNEK